MHANVYKKPDGPKRYPGDPTSPLQQFSNLQNDEMSKPIDNEELKGHATHLDESAITPETLAARFPDIDEKKLLRKQDLRLIPWLSVLYCS